MTMLGTGPEEAVEESNEAFYRAFRDRNLGAMEAIWASELPVACIHPGVEPLVGREAVLESWRGILQQEAAPRVVCSHVAVHVLGEVAFVTCLEGAAGQPPSLAATNVFGWEGGAWRLVHHQAGPLAVRQHGAVDEPDEPPILN